MSAGRLHRKQLKLLETEHGNFPVLTFGAVRTALVSHRQPPACVGGVSHGQMRLVEDTVLLYLPGRCWTPLCVEPASRSGAQSSHPFVPRDAARQSGLLAQITWTNGKCGIRTESIQIKRWPSSMEMMPRFPGNLETVQPDPSAVARLHVRDTQPPPWQRSCAAMAVHCSVSARAASSRGTFAAAGPGILPGSCNSPTSHLPPYARTHTMTEPAAAAPVPAESTRAPAAGGTLFYPPAGDMHQRGGLGSLVDSDTGVVTESTREGRARRGMYGLLLEQLPPLWRVTRSDPRQRRPGGWRVCDRSGRATGTHRGRLRGTTTRRRVAARVGAVVPRRPSTSGWLRSPLRPPRALTRARQPTGGDGSGGDGEGGHRRGRGRPTAPARGGGWGGATSAPRRYGGGGGGDESVTGAVERTRAVVSAGYRVQADTPSPGWWLRLWNKTFRFG